MGYCTFEIKVAVNLCKLVGNSTVWFAFFSLDVERRVVFILQCLFLPSTPLLPGFSPQTVMYQQNQFGILRHLQV